MMQPMKFKYSFSGKSKKFQLIVPGVDVASGINPGYPRMVKKDVTNSPHKTLLSNLDQDDDIMFSCTHIVFLVYYVLQLILLLFVIFYIYCAHFVRFSDMRF